ncbi:MAG: 3'-5' exonuclease domain-containing protein 2 [Paludibacter sp.]|jgi:ribonuclease D|nr:3'-5' exonuclease domain-containing protein 2 [Paludibacter sp.]
MFQAKITKEELAALPVAEFSGEIVCVETPEQVQSAIDTLQQYAVVGIDTETKPAFERGKRNKVALLQIATTDKCFLFRLNKLTFIKELADFLADGAVRKIGLAVRDDFAGLNRQRRFSPANYIDLQNIVKNYGILELGLQKIFAIVFNQRISKTQRLTNWENAALTPQQQMYAATDAWATLLIYNRLRTEQPLSIEEAERIKAENE